MSGRAGQPEDMRDAICRTVRNSQARSGWSVFAVLCLLSSVLLGCQESRIREHFEKAEKFRSDGDLEAAASEYRAVVEMDSTQWDAQNNLGKMFQAMGRPDSALHHYRLALTADPDFVGAYFNKGVLFASQGLIDSSIASYEAAVDRDSTHFEALNNLGVMLEGAGRVGAAIERYTRAVTLRPDFAPAHANLGRSALLSGDKDLAIRSAHRAIDLRPGFIDGYITLGTAYLLKDEFDRSIQFLELASRFAPDDELVQQNLAYVKQKKAEHIDAKDAGAVRVSHIVVEKEALAELLAEQARSGADFGLLARTHSIDPSGHQDGDIGYFRPGDMLPAFEGVVQLLEPGEIGGPLKTPLGYHVLKRTY